MKDIKHFEDDLKELFSKYLNQKALEEDLEFPEEHDFYNLVDECEKLIILINEKVRK